MVDLPSKRQRLSLNRKRPIGFSPFLRSVSKPLPESDSRSGIPSDEIPRDVSPAPSSSSSDYEDSDSASEDEATEETVQVDLGFFDPKPKDFHGVKVLLQRYLGDKEWDLGGFVDLILAQTTVGTVVKSESDEEELESEKKDADEDEPYAVITALNLGRYGTHQCIKQLRDYILKSCDDFIMNNKLKNMFGEKEVQKLGLLVCERFINFPPQPILPLYEGLFDEVSWAIEDEPIQEYRDSFRFESYLILTRVFVSMERGPRNDESMIFPKVEDEILFKLCSSSAFFDFPRKKKVISSELKGHKEMGLLMILESSKVPEFRRQLKSLLEEEQ